MLVVVAAVRGQPDKRTEIVAALAACAAASRKDPGCRSYLFTSDVEDEHSYASIETWDDQASLDAHMQQPHTRPCSPRSPTRSRPPRSSPPTTSPRSAEGPPARRPPLPPPPRPATSPRHPSPADQGERPMIAQVIMGFLP